MNEREHTLMRAVIERLRPLGDQMIEAGWRPEIVVFTPEEPELARIPGYKAALVIPLDTARVHHPTPTRNEPAEAPGKTSGARDRKAES